MTNYFAMIVLLLSCVSVHAEDFVAAQKQVMALGDLTTAPATFAAQGFVADEGIKPIFMTALPWQGKPTRVFAWLGVPKNAKGKVPGVVLIHGGGGTAFKAWVKKWNDHGFAAISIAVEGQTDARDRANQNAWLRHEWAGPARVGIYGDSNELLQDQWMYHAVADVVLANSLLRSLPEVDAEKIGVMGISWGGVITSTVIGIDSRFAFAIPTYGCGNLAEAKNMYGHSLGGNQLYRQVWDPMVRLNRTKIPVLWFSWPEDSHFPLDSQAACYHAAPGSHMVALIPGMQHGHEAGWDPADSYAFADGVVREGKAWCVQIAAATGKGVARVEFTSTKILDRAVLVSTRDSGVTGSRKWIESPASLEKSDGIWHAKAAVPASTTAWFMNVRCGELTASSDFQVIGGG